MNGLGLGPWLGPARRGVRDVSPSIHEGYVQGHLFPPYPHPRSAGNHESARGDQERFTTDKSPPDTERLHSLPHTEIRQFPPARKKRIIAFDRVRSQTSGMFSAPPPIAFCNPDALSREISFSRESRACSRVGGRRIFFHRDFRADSLGVQLTVLYKR